jgi:hypothetical protein
MAKRLRMTSADYVAIAVSPALVMALVGSLVFFLIEVFYVGQHPARLNYVFAWFVFAIVLVARIAIEMGSERAFLFALPLGVITFLAMVRFVEQPGPFGQLVNVALLAVVWWSAHKLTWDCTLIDDDEDASGEGLMQQAQGPRRLFSRRPVGNGLRTVAESQPDGLRAVSERRGGRSLQPDRARREKGLPTPSGAENEPSEEFDDALPDNAPGWRYRSRKRNKKQRPHAPGLWVLYFSLAALPLFGMGQRWIPASDVGSRRYAFFLLVVYVAAGLSLLVTTSFLGLRRYLRQRRVEMPAPMAATWVGVGGALIVVIMVLVALIPRPAAEVAVSRVPWTIGSGDGLARSRTGIDMDHVEGEDEPDAATHEDAQEPGDEAARESQDPSADAASDQRGESDRSAQDQRGREPSRAAAANEPSNQPSGESQNDANRSTTPEQESNENAGRQADAADTGSGQPTGSEGLRAFESVSALPWSSIVDLFKWVFYFIIGLCILIFVWRNFSQIANSLVELFRQLRELLARLFGGGREAHARDGTGDGTSQQHVPLPKFHDFQNPFTTGRHEQLSPKELVRYTFEAFEAWARDSGHARTPDQTPHELVRDAIAPQSPMFAEARRMAELYGETAYGSGAVSREAANSLKRIWTMMHQATSPATSSLPASPGR